MVYRLIHVMYNNIQISPLIFIITIFISSEEWHVAHDSSFLRLGDIMEFPLFTEILSRYDKPDT